MNNNSTGIPHRKRSVGVMVIVGIDLVIGIGLSFGSALGMFKSLPFELKGGGGIVGLGALIFILLFIVIIGVLFIWAGFLTLKLRRLSYILNIFLSILGILLFLFHINSAEQFEELTKISFITSIISIIYFIFVIVYLTRPKVKEMFK